MPGLRKRKLGLRMLGALFVFFTPVVLLVLLGIPGPVYISQVVSAIFAALVPLLGGLCALYLSNVDLAALEKELQSEKKAGSEKDDPKPPDNRKPASGGSE